LDDGKDWFMFHQAFIPKALIFLLKKAGLLTCSLPEAFPSAAGEQWHEVSESIKRAYSSGNCAGFSPASLLSPSA